MAYFTSLQHTLIELLYLICPRLTREQACLDFAKVLSLRLVVESDLVFLPVLLFRSTRKQFHREFCDTSINQGNGYGTGNSEMV